MERTISSLKKCLSFSAIALETNLFVRFQVLEAQNPHVRKTRIRRLHDLEEPMLDIAPLVTEFVTQCREPNN